MMQLGGLCTVASLTVLKPECEEELRDYQKVITSTESFAAGIVGSINYCYEHY
jgi:hypothetical protein